MLDIVHQWLDRWATVANILLTVAIASATFLQWRVSQAVFKLQKAIEKDRSSVSFFPRFKEVVEGTSPGIVLEISNLNEVGAWLEQVRLEVHFGSPDQKRARAIPIEKVLPRWETESIHVSDYILELVDAGIAGMPATAFAEAEIWAKGKLHKESTIVYRVKVSQKYVTELQKP
jgi:hypothetical protein